jgi:beta-1,4-mannosyltransferase
MVAAADASRAAGEGLTAEQAAPIRLAYVGSAPTNPYLHLLYSHVARCGVTAVRCPSPSLRWLLSARGEIDVLHVHWPEGLYRARRGPRLLRRPLSWLKLARLAVRLASARLLGLRLVWTVHQVLPHERAGMLDLAAARLLALLSDALVAHDRATAAEAERRLRPRRPPRVVPHGSYRGVYGQRLGREETRRRLGIPRGAFVFLVFGQLRGYKGIGPLLDAFRALPDENARLLVAGGAHDEDAALRVRAAAAVDPRIVPLLEVMPDGDVADVYAAADVAVVARADGGTSGTLVLALTLATPVVAAATGAYPELVRRDAGWLFDPDAPGALQAALASALVSRHELAVRAKAAAACADALDWDMIADRLAELLRSIIRTPRRARR